MSTPPDNLQKKFEQVFLLLAEKTRGKESVEFETEGSCMAPLIMHGDILMVQRCEGRSAISTGDILVYRSGVTFCAHRYLYRRRRKGEEFLIVKSDNALGPYAEEISPDQVFGRVLSIKRGNRKNDFTSMKGRIGNTCLGMFIVFYSLFMRLVRQGILLKCLVIKRTLIPGVWHFLGLPTAYIKKFLIMVFWGKEKK